MKYFKLPNFKGLNPIKNIGQYRNQNLGSFKTNVKIKER